MQAAVLTLTLPLTLTLTANPNQAAVLTDDFETARPLRTKAALRPATPARPPASRPPASSDVAMPDLLGNERSASELLGGADARQLPVSLAALERGEAGGGEAAADAMPEQPTHGDGATRVTARVRERRDELESRERQRVNLYVRADEDDDDGGGREGAPISDAPLRR